MDYSFKYKGKDLKNLANSMEEYFYELCETKFFLTETLKVLTRKGNVANLKHIKNKSILIERTPQKE